MPYRIGAPTPTPTALLFLPATLAPGPAGVSWPMIMLNPGVVGTACMGTSPRLAAGSTGDENWSHFSMPTEEGGPPLAREGLKGVSYFESR